MEPLEKFGDIVYGDDNMFEQYSYLPLSECSFSMSPESLFSPHSMTMSPLPQQVPQEDNLLITVGTDTYQQNTRLVRNPSLKIIIQPTTKFRFRYKSEMSGTHGCLSGSKKKSYPTVQLVNYSGNATISCTLVQNNERHEVHPHRLVTFKGDDEDNGPVDVHVGPENKYIARFPNMAILFTGKKSIAGELLKLKTANTTMSKDVEFELRKRCEMEARNINLNSACLEFTAYDENRQMICEPIYSNPIDNSKSAETCMLRITNISKTSGSCNGGDTVFMFVEKVNKKNIKIKFFELENDVRVWEEYAIFSELDVHHQFGIVFKTPAYRNVNITQDVDVFIELYRPKDKATSDEIPFRYKVMPRQSKKRRIVDDLSSTFLSSEEISPHLLDVPISDVPVTVTNLNNANNLPMIEYLDIGIPNLPLPSIKSHQNNPNFANTIKNCDSSNENYDSFDLDKFLCDFTKNGSTAYIVNPEIFFPNIVKDTPSKHSQYSKIDQVIVEQESCDAVKIRNVETSKIIVKKCLGIYPKKDVESLLKLNVFSQKELWNKDITKNLIKTLDDGLSNGENFLHMLVTIDEKNLCEAIINFMQHHKLDDNINSVNRQGETALHRAVNFYRTEFINLLLSRGCNPNIQDENGNTAMHLCIMNSNFDCVPQLLAYNKLKTDTMPPLDLDISNCDGYTSLHLAFICVSKINISQLLSANANPEIRTKNDNQTILHLAVNTGNIDLVKFVIENTSVSVNACTFGGATALHFACVSENKNAPEICQHLLFHGANPFIECNGNSALNMAAQKPEIAEIIKKHIQENNLSDTPIITAGCEDNEFLDEKTMINVSTLLDKSGKWREVAKTLGYQSIIPICEDKNSPSAILLNGIGMEQNVSVEDLYKLLLKLGIEDVAEEVKKVIYK